MENFDKYVEIAEWLALPLTYFILIVLFLFFVVRPFFAYLFDVERVKMNMDEKEEEGSEFPEEFYDTELPDSDEVMAKPSGVNEDRQKINKLAESDPAKAGDLVKQWLKKDEA